MKITIFGSAKPHSGEPAYDEAVLFGRLCAQAGHTVLTGGYIGTMEAVSRGAAEAGGHVIGVTCKEIEDWRGTRANPWVKEEWLTPTLNERIRRLAMDCDAAVALPGGPGTLAELATFWNLLIIHTIPSRPLILVGAGWRAVIETYFRELDDCFRTDDRNWVRFAPDVERVLALLD